MAINRPDKIEYARRLMTIEDHIMNFMPSHRIVQFIMNEGWVKSVRHAELLIQKARANWLQAEYSNQEEKRLLLIRQLKNKIYNMDEEYRNKPEGMRVELQYMRLIAQLEGHRLTPAKNEDDDVPPPPPVVYNQQVDLSLSADEIKLFDNELEDEY